jgi:hypothetical protein
LRTGEEIANRWRCRLRHRRNLSCMPVDPTDAKTATRFLRDKDKCRVPSFAMMAL